MSVMSDILYVPADIASGTSGLSRLQEQLTSVVSDLCDLCTGDNRCGGGRLSAGTGRLSLPPCLICDLCTGDNRCGGGRLPAGTGRLSLPPCLVCVICVQVIIGVAAAAGLLVLAVCRSRRV